MNGKPFCRCKIVKTIKYRDSMDKFKFYLCWRWKEGGKTKSKDIYIGTTERWKLQKIPYDIIEETFDMEFIKKFKGFENYDEMNKMFITKLNEVYKDIYEPYKEQEEKNKQRYEEEKRNEQRKRADEQRKEQEEYQRVFEEYFGGKGKGTLDFGDEGKNEMVKEMFKAGYKKVAHKYHPDHGGKDEDMVMLKEVYDEIKKMVK